MTLAAPEGHHIGAASIVFGQRLGSSFNINPKNPQRHANPPRSVFPSHDRHPVADVDLKGLVEKFVCNCSHERNSHGEPVLHHESGSSGDAAPKINFEQYSRSFSLVSAGVTMFARAAD